MIDLLTSALMILGTFFTVAASIGLWRMPDFYTRLHAPTKAATLGVVFTILAAVVFFIFRQETTSIRELLAIAFIFLTSPVSSHLLCKAARAQGLPFHQDTQIED